VIRATTDGRDDHHSDHPLAGPHRLMLHQGVNPSPCESPAQISQIGPLIIRVEK
jgi:hypothetical protein